MAQLWYLKRSFRFIFVHAPSNLDPRTLFPTCAAPAQSPQMALGPSVLSWRFCRPFWTRPFGCFTSPPWKVKPANAVKRCGHHAAKPPHAVFYIITNILNHLHVDTFRWRDVPEVTIIVIISQMRIAEGNLRVFIQTFKGCDDGNFYRPSN